MSAMGNEWMLWEIKGPLKKQTSAMENEWMLWEIKGP